MGTMFNGWWHEVCGDCGCVVGHGCPTAEPCDCKEEEYIEEYDEE